MKGSAPRVAAPLLLALTTFSAPLLAQEPASVPVAAAPPVPTPDPGEDEEIVVTGTRERGAVVGDIPPEIQLRPADIRAFGASSIADLVAELAPQLASGRGRGGEAPVVLINGRRVSGFAEIRNFPPEALARVDILPEEVALKYGYAADQRVINFVLRERFRAFTGDVDIGGPTGGDRQSYKGQGNWLRIRKDQRISLEGAITRDTALLESDRDILSSAPLRPFDLAGNVTAIVPGQAIDPALSALARSPVTVAAVPAAAATAAAPLSAFAGGANAPNATDIGRYRTLLPDNRAATLAGSYATAFGDVSATFSGGLDIASTESRQGLPGVSLTLPAGNPFSPFGNDVLVNRYGPGALIQTNDNWTGRAGLSLNGVVSRWQWALTGNYNHSESTTLTDRSLDVSAAQARILAGDPGLNVFGPAAVTGGIVQDRAHSNTDNGDLALVASGTVVALPAGPLTGSVKVGGQALSLRSDATRLGNEQFTSLSRSQGNFQGSFDLPLTSRRNEILPAIGDLSVNFNAAIDQLSDFGTLTTTGYGLNWKPRPGIVLIASVTNQEGAPSVQQLGNPQLVTPNIRVFDFRTGTTAIISRIDGGNAALTSDSRRVFKLGATLKPFSARDLTISANFIKSRIRNPIASFPTATAELEAAFPDRFVRDAGGQLIAIDNRAVNFAESDREELRWGFTFSQPLKASAAEQAQAAARRAAFEARRAAGEGPGGAGGARAGGPPGGPPAGRGGGGGFGGRGGGGAEGRLQLSLFHTWHLRDRIVIRDGVPVLDLLNGSATGSSGGQPRHEIEMRAGFGKSGVGGRLSLNWQSGTQVLADPTGATTAPGDLRFSGLATLNLRLFADLGQRPALVQRAPWLRGSRISLAVNNITDARLDVRDRSGTVPIGYQPDLINPLGRTLTLSLRKLFF
ncbi:TonB-dependent receptor [Polymorphobacter fuscus]|uniref:TonB-dependent receptor n=1 Tax=Sandarakinorhabdus fusca TaxID=1439888 RepID=A0A7C9KNR8_9SPHN|nr:TonB-dependent receptor [Polymorphobacter fuscus]MQT17944.1 TonB-dependent receptor [Polymorphobacter fuscus]